MSKLTRSELAKLKGVSVSTLRRWESEGNTKSSSQTHLIFWKRQKAGGRGVIQADKRILTVEDAAVATRIFERTFEGFQLY